MCLRIIEMRAYARAKHTVETTENLDDLPDDELTALAQENQFEMAKRYGHRRTSG
jgi:hypothetical protein